MLGSITFYYPSRVLGGAELLFVRLARYLVETKRCRVSVIDYADGVLANLLAESGVEVIPYVPGVAVPTDTCLITPLSKLITFESELTVPPQARVAFWSLHPYNAVTVFPGCRLVLNWDVRAIKVWLKTVFGHEYKMVKLALHEAHSRNALYFMDYENLRVNRLLFQLDFSARYLPIPLPALEPGTPHRTNRSGGGGVINLGWLGRLADHKIYTLLKVLRDAVVHAEQTTTRLRFHVIGDGEMATLLSMAPTSPYVEVIRTGTLSGNALTDYLAVNVDVLFAMGTSCLEGARLRIPTVLVDASYSELPTSYKYKWLFETTGFTLGQIVTRSALPANPHDFVEVIASVREPADRRRIGDRCYQYYDAHHSMEAIAGQLLVLLQENSLTSAHWADLGVSRPGIVRWMWQTYKRAVGRE